MNLTLLLQIEARWIIPLIAKKNEVTCSGPGLRWPGIADSPSGYVTRQVSAYDRSRGIFVVFKSLFTYKQTISAGRAVSAQREHVQQHLSVVPSLAAFQFSTIELNTNKSCRALIAHEDKPGLFKFVWYCTQSSVKFCHHSFLCVNNGYFVDGIVRWNLTSHSHNSSFLMQLLCPTDSPSSASTQTVGLHSHHSSPRCKTSRTVLFAVCFRLTPAQSKR